ncbi:cysteine-rich CWC family protein [Thauera sp. JM12B12]|uniref:cysteine-rich CWC family protein n=1 Tax=Thauera sp. JM12B12 TaxID=3142262 RepID=UPI0031F367FB
MPMSEPTNTCPRCGAAFTCGMQAGEPACWCAAYPAAFAVPEAGALPADAGCYCPRCLSALIEERRARLAQEGGQPPALR